MSDVEYAEPRTAEEACAHLERYGEDARLLAGGTALVLFLRQGLLTPNALVNLQFVEGLHTIEETSAGTVIGAMATHAEVARSPIVQRVHPALAETFRLVATPRIRHVATVGGNLAHGDPHLDPPVTLMALDAHVSVQSARAARSIPLSDFFVHYYETRLAEGELLTHVHVPPRESGAGLAFLKFLPRSRDDYATVDIAVWLRLDADQRLSEVRIALGSVGPVVFRARDAESILRGQEWPTAPLREAAEMCAAQSDPEDDVRGSADYKRELIRELVPRVALSAYHDAIGAGRA